MNPVLQFPPPHSDSTREADLSAREAALDIRASCIVEAPAGSGKTGLLMQRFLKLLAEGAVANPGEVLAITFTNKATAELHERVIAQLGEAAANDPPESSLDAFEATTRTLAIAVLERDAERAWGLLARPRLLNIRTIDSVCSEIASALPLLSGTGGSRSTTSDARPLYRLAAQRTLLQLGGLDTDLHEALRTVLLHRDASLIDVEALLIDMLMQRDQWAELVPLGPGELTEESLDTEIRPRLEQALQNIVCAGLTCAANAMPSGMLHELASLAAQLGLNPGYNGGASPIAFCSDHSGPPEEKADHLDHWQALISLLLTKDGDWRKSFNSNVVRFEMNKLEKAALQHLIDTHKSDALCDALCAVRNLPDAAYPDDQWAVCKALFRVLRRALAELKVLFAERRECDFTEIALAARSALVASTDEGSADVDFALASGGNLRHLLVDEMQDTSANQYELIHLLTRSWDGATQTLFLVGDPKQSIYLFRQARVERFLRTVREGRLGDLPLQPLRLTANFRSQAGLVRCFNSTFERIFPPSTAADTADVPFVAATPVRPATPTRNTVWHSTVSREEALDFPQTQSPQRDHEIMQARSIRRVVEEWRSAPLPPGRTRPWRIAILARVRKHLAPIVAEFKRNNGTGPLRYRAVEIDPLNERPEVFDVVALTRALLHPADRAAWLAVLHAPWCGLSLSDLLALTGEGDQADSCATVPDLVAERANNLSADGQQLLARIWPQLQTALATIGQSPLDVHVERTWRSLGGDAALTPEERTNVLRYLEVLREVQSGPDAFELRTLLARLEKLYAEPISGDVAVDLLTIHKAKGLEWDVVLVPSLEKRGASTAGDLLNWLEIDSPSTPAAGVILAPINSKGSDTDKLNKWLNSARETRENAERKRLFYVLMTRAREELHLFSVCKRKNDGTLGAPVHGSLLKAVWPAAADSYADLQSPPSTGALATTLQQALSHQPEHPLGLALAAAAAPDSEPELEQTPLIQRLPLSFSPTARFAAANSTRLPYAPASALHHAPAFERPEGSFAVRAFGNVVHRYLQLIADRLETTAPDSLLTEVSAWTPRLAASLRAEGLPPSTYTRLAPRALQAVQVALTDAEGRWILSPHAESFNEQSLRYALNGELRPEIRSDRTFLAGASPLSSDSTHLWIVDFKTTEQGSRSDQSFAAQERQKYAPQLESYARAYLSLPATPAQIMLALYYPLVPRLLYWPAAALPL